MRHHKPLMRNTRRTPEIGQQQSNSPDSGLGQTSLAASGNNNTSAACGLYHNLTNGNSSTASASQYASYPSSLMSSFY